MYEYKAKKLYINKVELEKALGIGLSEVKTKLLPAPSDGTSSGIARRLNEIQIGCKLQNKDKEIARLNAKIKDLEHLKPVIDSAEKDLIIQQLQTELIELKNKLQQSSTTSKNPLEEDYIHPTKEETYQHLIYALTMGRANKDFFPMAYFTSKGHLKPSTVINDLLRDLRNSDIDGLNEQAMRKRLAKILKMDDLKAE